MKKPLLLAKVRQSAENVLTSHGCSEGKLPYATFNSTLPKGPMFSIKRAINSRENRISKRSSPCIMIVVDGSDPTNGHKIFTTESGLSWFSRR